MSPFIPVQIDDIKQHDRLGLTRCTYFCVACDDPSPGWTLTLSGRSLPMMLVDLSGVLWRPASHVGETFSDAAEISELFAAIEQHGDLYVDIDSLWLPNSLLKEVPARRGTTLRVGLPLFALGVRFYDGRIGTDEFIADAGEMMGQIAYDEREDAAFRQWALNQVSEVTESYPKNAELALEWREEGQNRG